MTRRVPHLKLRMFPWVDQRHVASSLKCLVDHEGQIEEVIKIIYAAKEAGADVVQL